MKYLRFFIITTILILFPCMNLFAQDNIPENIRIGLYYLKTAVNSVELSSNTGLDIGCVINDTYISLLKDETLKTIIAKKDNYNFDVANSYAYHIQVGSTYTNLYNAQNLVTAFVKAGYNAYPSYDGNFRVWIGAYSGSDYANNDISKLKKGYPGYTYSVINPNAKNIQVISDNKIKLMFACNTGNFQVNPIPSVGSPNVCGINGVNYRGGIRIIRQTNSDMTIINVINLEQYLYSVVGTEMSSGWPIEALKAQAVAARTYAVKLLINGSNCTQYGYDMNNTAEFQAYKGYSKEGPSCIQAVDGTKGLVAYYDGVLISANYFSSSGGYTENSENVWVSEVPYLRSVEDKYLPPDTTNKEWKKTATPQEIKTYLLSKGVDIGDITDVRVDSYSKAGNALNLKIVGTKGVQEYKKDNIRVFMRGFNGGGDFLLSQNFTITKPGSGSGLSVINGKLSKQIIALQKIRLRTKSKTTSSVASQVYIKSTNSTRVYTESNSSTNAYVFNGRGWGHGVGMSQWGAKGMANAGFTYEQILKHYYTGIEIK